MPIRRFRLIKQGLDDGSVLSDLNDVASTAPVSGDLLMWNGTEWVPSARGANPTGTVGLATVNGTALTYLRSDSAPALSQSIVPTWSAKHTFSVAPEFVSFELGSGATDTTFTRVSAGVAAIEGVNILTSATGLEPADIGVTVAAHPVLAAAVNSGAATSGWVLTADGAAGSSWAAAAGGAGGGNPTASVGLTAVNGSAATFLRSDGAPPLSQAIAPTWTGHHIFDGIGGGTYLGSPAQVAFLSDATDPWTMIIRAAHQNPLGDVGIYNAGDGATGGNLYINVGDGVSAAASIARFGWDTVRITTPLRVETIEVGADTDTTISRASAGIVAIEGHHVATIDQAQTISALYTFSTNPLVSTGLEVGHATDTTLARNAAGKLQVEGNILTRNIDTLGLTDLTDPNADQILFWDDSAAALKFLTPGTGLSISDTTLNVGGAAAAYADLPGTAYLYDDFIAFPGGASASNGWWTVSVAGSQTTITQIASESQHPGIVPLSTYASSAGRAGIVMNSSASATPGQYVMGTGLTTIDFYFRVPTLPITTTQVVSAYNIGMISACNAGTGAGVFIALEDSSGTWKFVGRSRATTAGATSVTGFGAAAVAGTWYHGQIIINAAGTSVEFLLDGSSLGSLTTNLPTIATNLGAVVVKSVGTTAIAIDLDLMMMKIVLTTPRWT